MPCRPPATSGDDDYDRDVDDELRRVRRRPYDESTTPTFDDDSDDRVSDDDSDDDVRRRRVRRVRRRRRRRPSIPTRLRATRAAPAHPGHDGTRRRAPAGDADRRRRPHRADDDGHTATTTAPAATDDGDHAGPRRRLTATDGRRRRRRPRRCGRRHAAVPGLRRRCRRGPADRTVASVADVGVRATTPACRGRRSGPAGRDTACSPGLGDRDVLTPAPAASSRRPVAVRPIAGARDRSTARRPDRATGTRRRGERDCGARPTTSTGPLTLPTVVAIATLRAATTDHARGASGGVDRSTDGGVTWPDVGLRDVTDGAGAGRTAMPGCWRGGRLHPASTAAPRRRRLPTGVVARDATQPASADGRCVTTRWRALHRGRRRHADDSPAPTTARPPVSGGR